MLYYFGDNTIVIKNRACDIIPLVFFFFLGQENYIPPGMQRYKHVLRRHDSYAQDSGAQIIRKGK